MMGSLRTAVIAIAAAASALSASAQVIDGFDAPAPGWTRTATGPRGAAASIVSVCEAGLPVPGGARDIYHDIYTNPLNSVTALAVGDGRLSVAQGTGAMAETLISYGAFTRVGCDPRVGGPLLRMDLSAAKSLRLSFSGAEDVLNLNVTYYTSAPLNPAAPVYYAGGGINIAPTTSGAPLEARLPVNNDPSFNWRQVDGIVVIINRSGPTPHTSYTLDRIAFSTTP